VIDKNNFKVNISQKSVVLEISKDIFPIPVILRAAYHFIDDAKVIVKEGGKNKVKVVFYFPEETGKEDLEEIGYEFNLQLISSFLENEESIKNAGIRDTIMKAALLPQQMGVKFSPGGNKSKEKQEK